MSGSEYSALESVGLPEIDHQHKNLQALIDDLVASILLGADQSDVLLWFDKVYDEWVSHCRSEEDVLEKRRSTRLAVMKAEHERIRKRVINLKNQYAADPQGFRDGTAVGEIRRLAIRHVAQYDVPEFNDTP